MNLEEETIKATKFDWPTPGVLFTEKSEPLVTLPIITRQLNSILYSVIQLRAEVATLKKELAEERKPKQAEQLDSIVRQLDGLHLTKKGETFQQQKGTIKVYQNPFELLKKITG